MYNGNVLIIFIYLFGIGYAIRQLNMKLTWTGKSKNWSAKIMKWRKSKVRRKKVELIIYLQVFYFFLFSTIPTNQRKIGTDW